MITTALVRLRERLFTIEDRLIAARHANDASPAVVATLHADAAFVRAEIAALKRQRFEREAQR